MNKIKRFAAYYRPHIGLFLLDICCATLVAAVDVAFPLLTNYIMKGLFPQLESMGPLPHLVLTFCLLLGAILFAYLLRTAMLYIVNYWGHLLGVRMEADMRRDIFSHIQTLPFGFYDKIRTGKLLSRATTDLFEISELAHHGPEDILISSLTILGAFITMFCIEWRIALAMSVLMPLCIFFVMRTRYRMKSTSKSVKEQMSNIDSNLAFLLSAVRSVITTKDSNTNTHCIAIK